MLLLNLNYNKHFSKGIIMDNKILLSIVILLSVTISMSAMNRGNNMLIAPELPEEVIDPAAQKADSIKEKVKAARLLPPEKASIEVIEFLKKQNIAPELVKRVHELLVCEYASRIFQREFNTTRYYDGREVTKVQLLNMDPGASVKNSRWNSLPLSNVIARYFFVRKARRDKGPYPFND